MSKKLGLFLASAGVIVIPVVTVIIVMQMRSSSHPQSGAISEEGYRGMPNGLLIKDEVVGTGDEVQNGKILKINYTGKFMDGKQFDSNHSKEKPFEMNMGSGGVIKGWEEGLAGMKVGGKRLLIVPPDLAYGKSGGQGIPPNSKLYFEIELLKVE
jgi:FKBP-type peptidyl-prolyl cis-trans isomerase